MSTISSRKKACDLSFWRKPVRIVAEKGRVIGVECVRMSLGQRALRDVPRPAPVDGSHFVIAADQVVKAIGQEKASLAARLNLKTVKGYIEVDDHFQTSLPGVYAGATVSRSGAAST